MGKEPQKDAPNWLTGILLAFLAVVVVMVAYFSMRQAAVDRKTEFVLLELTVPQFKYARQVFCVAVVGLLATSILFGYYSEAGKRLRTAAFFVVILAQAIFLIGLAAYSAYANSLARRGEGTMQMALDTEYHQEDMKVMGNLGIYGGRIKVDGEEHTYVCLQMDTFGPFDYQPLHETGTQAFSSGHEEFLSFTENGLEKVMAISVRQYQDGYWLVVKKFTNIQDLYIELDGLDDLRKYIIQMQYYRHTGDDIAREFRLVAGNVVKELK